MVESRSTTCTLYNQCTCIDLQSIVSNNRSRSTCTCVSGLATRLPWYRTCTWQHVMYVHVGLHVHVCGVDLHVNVVPATLLLEIYVVHVHVVRPDRCSISAGFGRIASSTRHRGRNT